MAWLSSFPPGLSGNIVRRPAQPVLNYRMGLERLGAGLVCLRRHRLCKQFPRACLFPQGFGRRGLADQSGVELSDFARRVEAKVALEEIRIALVVSNDFAAPTEAAERFHVLGIQVVPVRIDG